eukprot:5882361-Prymnesium_polylepis.1
MHGERPDLAVRRIYAPATLTIDSALQARGIRARRVAIMKNHLARAMALVEKGDVLSRGEPTTRTAGSA